MLIKYEFLKGQSVEVEVADELGAFILETEHKSKNRDRAETRRHESIYEWDDRDSRMVDESADIVSLVIRNMDVEALHKAIAKLKPDEQELVHRLYLDKHPLTQAEYAKQIGMTEKYIKRKAQRIREKIKKQL